MKCVAGHQPNLYPYGGFFAKVASVDTFVIVDNTQYVKKQYHNRNQILLQNGQVQWLTIPVKNAGHFKQKINEVEIENSSKWSKKHTRTLQASYRKAEHFELFFPQLEDLFNREWIKLFDFNKAFIELCLKFLEIKTPILIASEEGIDGKASSLILDICRKTGSDTYLHGKHSRDYVDFDYLAEAGIKNLIQDFSAKEYPQGTTPFIPNLSIIDIIFHCGKEARDLLLDSQTIDGTW